MTKSLGQNWPLFGIKIAILPQKCPILHTKFPKISGGDRPTPSAGGAAPFRTQPQHGVRWSKAPVRHHPNLTPTPLWNTCRGLWMSLSVDRHFNRRQNVLTRWYVGLRLRLIDKSQWCSSAKCGRPLHVLTNNWTRGKQQQLPFAIILPFQNKYNTLTALVHKLYAMKILRAHGMTDTVLQQVYRSVILSKLQYTSCAWSGFTKASRQTANRHQASVLQSYNLRGKLLNQVLYNPLHVLHQLVPRRARITTSEHVKTIRNY